jgi:hypothetical protein
MSRRTDCKDVLLSPVSTEADIITGLAVLYEARNAGVS